MEETQATHHPDEVRSLPFRRAWSSQVSCRVLNTFKAMVADDDFLEKEDMYILDRMKEFLLQDAVSKIAISKQLVILIDRAVGRARLPKCFDADEILSALENSKRRSRQIWCPLRHPSCPKQASE